MINIVLFPITIAVGLLIIAISIILYRKHLSKVASGKEHNIHSRVIEPRTVIRFVLICVLGIWLLVAMIKISNIEEELDNINCNIINSQNSLIGQLDNQIYSLYDKLDSQDDIASNYWYTFKNVDTENKTIEMELDVQLKEYRKDASVSVTIGNTVATLQNNGGVFTGSIPIGLFTYYETYPILTVETDGIIQSQELKECPVDFLGEKMLTTLDGIRDNECSFEYDKKGNLNITGNITVKNYGSEFDEFSVNSASIVFELDGGVLKELPLKHINETDETTIKLSESFPAKKNQQFDIYLKYVNKAGWTVKDKLAYYGWDSGIESVCGDVLITDQNGVILFK